MSSDFSIGSFDEDDFGDYRGNSPQRHSKEENFHTMIHPATVQCCHRFYAEALPESGQHITQAYRSSVLRVNSRPSRGGPDDDSAVRTYVEGTYTWGDSNGPTYSLHGDAAYRDNRGNYVKGEIDYDSNNRGRISASAGHEKNNKTSKSE